MAQLRTLVVAAALFASVLDVAQCLQSYEYHESAELGHIRYENGTVDWGTFPLTITNSSRGADPRSDGWDVTVKFAVAIVESVQTQTFPYDLIRRMTRNQYTANEVIGYQTNIIVMTSMGVLFAVAILVAMLVYKLRQKRRGDKEELIEYFYEIVPRRAQIIVGLGAALIIIDTIFVLCSLITSGQSLTGCLDLGDSVNTAIDDVVDYFTGLEKNFNFVAVNTSQWFLREVIVPDVNEVGRLIWETGRDEFLPLISPTLALVSDLDTKAFNTLSLLTTLNTDLQDAMTTVVADLDLALTEVHYNLTLSVRDFSCGGCDGSCAGCSVVVPDDIFLMADFSTLPNITGNINGLGALLSSSNVSGTSKSPEYYLLYGIGELITQDPNVTAAKDQLISDLLEYADTWGNATVNITYANASTFWFDTLRPRFNEFYDGLRAGEIARFTFAFLFCVGTLPVLGLTIYAVVLAKRAGLFIQDKDGTEDFVKPKKWLGWCLVGQMSLASSHMLLSAVGFYIGANLQNAICEPGSDLGPVHYIVDYPDTMSGHPDYYMSSVLLGNGSYGPILMSDVLRNCSNGTSAYSAFLYDIIVPNLQQDLQNYTQHLTTLDELFEMMRVDLPSNTTLVPPEFVTWLNDFSIQSLFNFTLYDDMLNGVVINADVDTYTNNLDTIYNTDVASGGPFEPAKSQLPMAVYQLQDHKDEIAQVETLKIALAAIFADYVATRTDILTSSNQTIEELIALEPALLAMSAGAISRGVDAYKAELLAILEFAANTTWPWMNEAAPCEQISDAYNATLSAFCDQYADYVNANWLLEGHTSFFLLLLSALTFLIYRAMPDPEELATGAYWSGKPKTGAVMVGSGKNSMVDSSANTSSNNSISSNSGNVNFAFDLVDDDAAAAPLSSPTPAPAPAKEAASKKSLYQKGGKGKKNKTGTEAWIDFKQSLAGPQEPRNPPPQQRNVLSVESLDLDHDSGSSPA